MKKLLVMLTTITSLSSIAPIVLANAPTSVKIEENKIVNNEINYLKTNNLETLNRTKRQATPIPNITNNNFHQNSPELSISKNSKSDMESYFRSLVNNFIPFLTNNDIIRTISPRTITDTITNRIESNFFINPNSNYQYFTMSINIENVRNISLIFRSNDLYLQGFIGHPTENNQTLNVYYYFRDATITNVPGTTRSQEIPFESNYKSTTGLQASAQAPIKWAGIVSAFHDLANYGENPRTVDTNTLRAAFVRVILATTESLRFRSVRNQIISNYDTDSESSHWGWYSENFLNNWDSITTNARTYLDSGTLIGFSYICDVMIFSKNLSPNFRTCGEHSRKGRDLNNQNEYCPVLEKKFYFNEDKSDKEFKFNYGTSSDNGTKNSQITINLGDINPINFKKISFIGDTSTYSTWGDYGFDGTKISDFFDSKNIKTIIKNKKVANTYSENQNNAIYNLQGQDDKGIALAKVHLYQKIGLTFYWENGNYYLQILVYQSACTEYTTNTGYMLLKIGKGIKLFNN